MQLLKTTVLITGLIFCLTTTAQNNLFPSRVKLETKIADSTWFAVSGAGIVQVNEGSGEIAFKMGIQTIVTDVQKLNAVLGQIENEFVFLRGSFPVKSLSFADADNENSEGYSGKALFTLNGISKEIDYTCEIYSLNNDDEFAVGNSVYQLRIGLFFEFEPLDFKLNALYKSLTKTIKVEISNGLINKMTNGGDSIFPK